ncbi:hypothetical protein ABVF61_31140 [Roseibium sp. HPY-6]|uniref:hypothetical protein n=1 Tax=Roseibium sp. HPY-6 TaxID=3229852 RepID=UPI0033903A4D
MEKCILQLVDPEMRARLEQMPEFAVNAETLSVMRQGLLSFVSRSVELSVF